MKGSTQIMVYWIVGALLVGIPLLWYCRVLQVILFLLAAGLRRAVLENQVRPSASSESWNTEAMAAPVKMTKPNPVAMVTYHPEYQAFNPARVDEMLIRATKMNAGWLRSDIRWREILPDGVNPNEKAIAWYRAFLSRAREHGFQNLAVLSTPPDRVEKAPVPERVESWLRFVELVARRFGPLCDGFQLMNEPNTPVYNFLPRTEAARAIAAGTAILKASDPSTTISVNIAMDMWGWRDYLADLLAQTESSIDIIGLDHYPGTWALGRQDRWRDVRDLAELIRSAEPGSAWFRKRLAIMETGYSTNSWLRDEAEQSAFFSRLDLQVRELRRTTSGLAFVGIYELCDRDSSAFLDPEAHFGLLKSDGNPKKAFVAVRKLFESRSSSIQPPR